MLVIFYGCSCVGKTSIMEALNTIYGWQFVTILTTRPSRQKETYKITLKISNFEQEVRTEKVMFVNECYQNLYGVSKLDIATATSSKSQVWMLDLSIVNQHEAQDLQNTKRFVILPENESQLISQIFKSHRCDREELIIEEYRKYYSNLKQGFNWGLNAFCILNRRDCIGETANMIIDVVDSA